MSDTPLIINELTTSHLCLYTAPQFEGIVTRVKRYHQNISESEK